jgi:tetratricopeptide (TPR) repeat protein
MNPIPSNPDPYAEAVDAMARACAEAATDFPAAIEQAAPQMESGLTLAEIRGMSSEDCEAMYRRVDSLVREQRYPDALPTALMLAAHWPGDARFLFAAGLCLQLTGEPQLALGFHARSLELHAQPETALQLGECWAAAGNSAEALRCFEVAAMLSDDLEPGGFISVATEAAFRVQQGDSANAKEWR